MSERHETAERMIEMAGGDLDEDFEGDDDGGGGNKRLLLIVVLPLLLVVGGTAGAVLSGLADPLLAMLSGEEPAAVEDVAEGAETLGGPGARRAPVGSAIFYDLPEMLANLNTAGQKRTFLKMLVSLELASDGDIIDNFQVFLRELRLEDLQGAAGMNRLRVELLDRVNAAVRPARVNDVLFKEMIVQ